MSVSATTSATSAVTNANCIEKSVDRSREAALGTLRLMADSVVNFVKGVFTLFAAGFFLGYHDAFNSRAIEYLLVAKDSAFKIPMNIPRMICPCFFRT